MDEAPEWLAPSALGSRRCTIPRALPQAKMNTAPLALNTSLTLGNYAFLFVESQRGDREFLSSLAGLDLHFITKPRVKTQGYCQTSRWLNYRYKLQRRSCSRAVAAYPNARGMRALNAKDWIRRSA